MNTETRRQTETPRTQRQGDRRRHREHRDKETEGDNVNTETRRQTETPRTQKRADRRRQREHRDKETGDNEKTDRDKETDVG